MSQPLFKKASAAQKELLLRHALFPNGEDQPSAVYEISVNKAGTLALQNIIDSMVGNTTLGEMLVRALHHSLVNDQAMDVTLLLIKDKFGTHIMQRVMKTFPR